MKSQVFYFIADSKLDIVHLINNNMDDKFRCLGVGNKAYKTAMKEAKPNESVHQVKITTSQVELLYTY